jgi:hypothetical protein
MPCLDNGDVLELKSSPKVANLSIRKSQDEKRPNDVTAIFLNPGFKFNTSKTGSSADRHTCAISYGTLEYMKELIAGAVFCYCPTCRRVLVDKVMSGAKIAYIDNWREKYGTAYG